MVVYTDHSALSGLKETTFLRQFRAADGSWEVWYSPIIDSTTTGYDPIVLSPCSALKQWMFCARGLAASLGTVNNLTPESEWVVST